MKTLFRKEDDEFQMETLPNEGPLARTAGELLGTSTGEHVHEITPGGWEGTDDATSTTRSDLAEPNLEDWPDSLEEAALQVRELPRRKRA